MPRGLVLSFIAAASLLPGSALVHAVSASLVQFESHHIQIKLDVPAHSATIADNGVMKVTQGTNLFYLRNSAEIESFALDGTPVTSFFASSVADAPLTDKLAEEIREREMDEKVHVVRFERDKDASVEFSLRYTSEFNEDPSNMRFSRERVGGEVTGTILDKGAYLSGGSYFYPTGDEDLVSFKLTADIPDTWESISDGNQVTSESRDGRKIQTWENPFKSDGCMFMAAPYVLKSVMVDSVEVWCYFFEADTGLFEEYLPATADYIEMYTELIGPYPYQRFTVAENFFPTGYGMPAWTLLGQRVLQMPFIVKTSLGHEVLHNWWGNSVYVDYDRGNWCEGLTVYGADYRYKLMQSEDAAKSYRKDILKQFVSYVNSENDFPLREFTSRSSPDTRSIGYGKAMMVFHMIEEEIGTEPFFEAWKLVYRRHIEQKIGWEEWIAAFEETSGADLSHIIPQWIDRAGAPTIALGGARKSDDNVSAVVSQSAEQIYRIKIPVRLSGPDVAMDTSFALTGASTDFSAVIQGSSSALEIDPDFHLFRKLYPEEVEPIVSSVMGKDDRQYFTPDSRIDVVVLFAEFGTNIEDDSVAVQTMSAFANADQTCAQIVLNPAELPEYLKNKVVLTSQTATIQGTEYPRKGHTLVLTGQNWEGHDRCMVIITTDFASLPRLGQLIPHYGKYSLLVFKGTRNIGKGQWEVDSSPLKVSLQ
ncbi:MAG: M1 family aminopeptidase [candidate division Zixibacteria bacterium]|nr:M1 family aminopeptidase [candidate division Zixibacteria bacterium]MDH3938372.1 M1 family aminopeptidase [candidate division Zixibacteria bacterium]MDH4033515.1 M1 family aminopeptidase [candidate division Zixibacteria bacterium]